MNGSWGRDQWLKRDPGEWRSFLGGSAMASNDRSRAGRTGELGQTARARTKAAAERPFDTWLQKQLHAMYDEIASEPLPDDLLGLIDRDAAESGAESASEKNGESPTATAGKGTAGCKN